MPANEEVANIVQCNEKFFVDSYY